MFPILGVKYRYIGSVLIQPVRKEERDWAERVEVGENDKKLKGIRLSVRLCSVLISSAT